MFAALGLHSSPMAKGEQLCHARNISRVLCPQKKSISAEDDAPEEEEAEGGCGCHGNAAEDAGIQISKRLIQVAVKRDAGGSLGLTLCGGACASNATFSRPLIISHIRPGGPVHMEGSIRPGDRLLAVDGHSTEHATLVEAQALLLRHNHCISWERDDPECSGGSTPCCSEECCTLLVIEYDVVVREGLVETRGPFLVELQMEHPGEELGLSLAMLPEDGGTQSRPAALVEAVRPASIAERCGALHPGDVLLSIGEVQRRGGGSDAGGQPGGSPRSSWVLHMEVLPLSQMDVGRCTSNNSRCSDFGSRERSKEQGGGVSCSSPLVVHGGIRYVDGGGKAERSAMGSSGSSSSSLVWSVEPSVPVVEGQGWRPRASPAHLLGESSMQRGEEILQLEEFLQTTESRAASDHGENLPPPWQQGSFQSLGGALLDADTQGLVPMRRCSEEVGSEERLLGASQRTRCWITPHKDEPFMGNPLDEEGDDDCVAAKGLAQDDPNEDKEMEVYMVRVPRDGGPLGITLSGTEDPQEYVTISALVEGGPAKRTAALGIGDRLLAVGGESLVGRPLSEAVTLLRAASDPVILHVARPSSHLQPPASSPSPPTRDEVLPARRRPEQGPLLDLFCDSVGDARAAPLSMHGSCGGGEYEEEGVPEVDHAAPPTFHPSVCHQPPINHHLNQSASGNHSLANDMNRPVSYDSDQQLSVNHSSLTHSVGGSVRGGSAEAQQPPRTETLRLTLYKDGIYEDFGFSVSDGLYERGVYVNRIRNGGPADIGSLLPYDRIIQVNDTMTYAFDCCLTVPLIASAGDKIDLTIVRSL
ncbi:glutamate receptor-interacting protein 2 isoform X2 [Hetaerina americana]|uniref:glutamate receptor-interacting protein 2 isoform X2 n=1 Tax=Hetaerina americana TaxID=62018 RepID=UPI003A7F27B2